MVSCFGYSLWGLFCFHQLSHFQLLLTGWTPGMGNWQEIGGDFGSLSGIRDLKCRCGYRWAEGWRGLGWVVDDALLGMERPTFPWNRSLSYERSRESRQIDALSFTQRLFSPHCKLRNFVRVSIALPTAVCHLSAAPDMTESQSRGTRAMGYRNAQLFGLKRGNIRCCFSNKDPVSCLTPHR